MHDQPDDGGEDHGAGDGEPSADRAAGDGADHGGADGAAQDHEHAAADQGHVEPAARLLLHAHRATCGWPRKASTRSASTSSASSGASMVNTMVSGSSVTAMSRNAQHRDSAATTASTRSRTPAPAANRSS